MPSFKARPVPVWGDLTCFVFARFISHLGGYQAPPWGSEWVGHGPRPEAFAPTCVRLVEFRTRDDPRFDDLVLGRVGAPPWLFGVVREAGERKQQQRTRGRIGNVHGAPGLPLLQQLRRIARSRTCAAIRRRRRAGSRRRSTSSATRAATPA